MSRTTTLKELRDWAKQITEDEIGNEEVAAERILAAAGGQAIRCPALPPGASISIQNAMATRHLPSKPKSPRALLVDRLGFERIQDDSRGREIAWPLRDHPNVHAIFRRDGWIIRDGEEFLIFRECVASITDSAFHQQLGTANQRANSLADECGRLRDENGELLKENAMLRRKLERATRSGSEPK